jgi:LmbE family N-acetylglucosaminyl deacetylase
MREGYTMQKQDTPPRGTQVLLVMAHPDDAELSSAGTLIKWTAEGKQVRYVVCTTGDKGTKDAQMTPFRLAEIREQEQREAARVIGVNDITFLRHADGELEHSASFRNEIALLIRKFRPDIIITHDPWRPYQLHPDHRAVGFATVDAVVVARDHLFLPALMELGLPAHAPLELFFTFPPTADYVVDITDVIKKKLEALEKHKSQLEIIPDWREKIRFMSSQLAEGHPFTYAESFKRLVLTYQ